MFEQRNCPTCGSSASTAKIVDPDVNPGTLSSSEISEIWSGFHSKKTFFPYKRCSSCGLAYSDCYFDDLKLSELYSFMGNNIHSQDVVSDRRTKDLYEKQISTHTQDIKRIIEIGPDIGYLAAKLNSAHGPLEMTFVEPNKTAYSHLEKIPAKSVEVFDDLENLKETNAKFDLAIAIHVLDHLKEPVKSLEKLHGLLKPGGTIFVVTHNERSLLARTLGRRWPGYCVQHPHLFNKKSLTHQLNVAGFEDVRARSVSNVFPMNYLLEHVVLALFQREIKFRILPGGMKLPLGNIFAIGRKSH